MPAVFSAMNRSWIDAPASLYSIPIVWALAMIPHAQKNILAARAKRFNNLAPRSTVQRIQSDNVVEKELARRVARYEGAHQNGMESFPLWAVAVTVGNICGIENRTLNICAALFVSSRILYNRLYATQQTRSDAAKRSLTWWVGVGVSMFLILRGSILRSNWSY